MSIEPYIQEPPFCIQIELTEGCNLRCNFCGLNGIRGKDNDFKYMTLDTATSIANNIRSLGWNSRLEFAMHGEPSLNPNRDFILSLFRTRLPKTNMMMTSNGAGFVKDPTTSIDEALRYLNVLALDWYDGIALVPKILDRYSGQHEVRYYPDDKGANPHRRLKAKERLLSIVRDISSSTKGTHSTLNNHCGAGSPKNQNAQGKRCAKPFREMSIRWDGSIAICCNDWRGVYKIGNVNKTGLEELWHSKEFNAARKKLYHGMRDFDPCDGCDATSYRSGLLPDKLGKYTLEKPNALDLKVIAEATGGKSFTLPVLRPWEVEPS